MEPSPMDIELDNDKSPPSTNFCSLLMMRRLEGRNLYAVPSSLKAELKKISPQASIDCIIRDSPLFISRLQIGAKLKSHGGCVNSVEWNADGSKIITGSDDCRLKVWSGKGNYALLRSHHTGHFRNIFSARFVPQTDDTQMVSCGMDGQIRHTVVAEAGETRPSKLLGSFTHMVLKIFFVPNLPPQAFVTTHHDGTVRLFDLRESTSSTDGHIILRLRNGISQFSANSLAFDPLCSGQFVVGGGDPRLRLYDLRWTPGDSSVLRVSDLNKGIIGKFKPKGLNAHRDVNVTGVDYNIVATYSRDDVYLFAVRDLQEEDLPKPGLVEDYRQVYKGRTNVRTFLKEVSFLDGAFSRYGRSSFLATGSDCGNLFVWEKSSGNLVQRIKGDHSIVNGVTPHPTLPHIAVCGIDSFAKVLLPTSEVDTFDRDRATKAIEEEQQDDSDDDRDEMYRLIMAALEHRSQRNRALVAQENEKLEEANEKRLAANELFREGKCEEALTKYKAAIDLLQFRGSIPHVEGRRKGALIHCLNNIAACYIRLEKMEEAIEVCNQVLNIDIENLKALVRRAHCYIQQKRKTRALRDLNRALRIDEADGQLKTMLQKAKELEDDDEIVSDDEEEGEEEDDDDDDGGNIITLADLIQSDDSDDGETSD
ncbi:hypothetical protein PROFUN_15520 [Planoprotostelium fungivorum]|uniref:Uncharacterized protein n=1 Tax=Planoprotostelium fungivorum TaxID=1890364 RepID=A0A2P6MVW8_9EUKA|nr:hypothetical protein PROFUN_15520 [Planoprotostelium fungivorum]